MFLYHTFLRINKKTTLCKKGKTNLRKQKTVWNVKKYMNVLTSNYFDIKNYDQPNNNEKQNINLRTKTFDSEHIVASIGI